jgi:ssDNA-binding Zn-finger/Zn-ribbon topoisomerase 1
MSDSHVAVPPRPHYRRCWDCGNVALHTENVIPFVLCSKCDSQDTRLVKLEKCPFCGAPGVLHRSELGGSDLWSIGCTTADCREYVLAQIKAVPTKEFRVDQQRWNRRMKTNEQ